MADTITEDALRAYVRGLIRASGKTQRDWASSKGLGDAHLCNWLAGRVDCGRMMQKALGVERVHTYRVLAP